MRYSQRGQLQSLQQYNNDQQVPNRTSTNSYQTTSTHPTKHNFQIKKFLFYMLDNPMLPARTFGSQSFQQQEMAGLCFVIL
jgi:hypothetical protein